MMEETMLEHDGAPPDAVGSLDNIRVDAGDARREATSELSFVKGETLIVRGWIAESVSAPTYSQWVRVCVDDTIEAQVQPNVVRHDVVHAFGAANLEHSGFVAVLSSSRLDLGRHTLSVSVGSGPNATLRPMSATYGFDVTDEHELIPRLEACAEKRVSGNIDTWTAIPRITRTGATEVDVFVRGWACDLETRTPVAEIFGIADGRHTARAMVGYPRPDVAEWLGSPTFEACGFRLRMVVPAVVAYDGTIEVVALTGDRARRAPILSTKSAPRLPLIASGTNGSAETAFVDSAVLERSVLDDILEIDRQRDERAGVNFF